MPPSALDSLLYGAFAMGAAGGLFIAHRRSTLESELGRHAAALGAQDLELLAVVAAVMRLQACARRLAVLERRVRTLH